MGPWSKAYGPPPPIGLWVLFCEPEGTQLPDTHVANAALGPVSSKKRGEIVMKLYVILEDEGTFERSRPCQKIYHFQVRKIYVLPAATI